MSRAATAAWVAARLVQVAQDPEQVRPGLDGLHQRAPDLERRRRRGDGKAARHVRRRGLGLPLAAQRDMGGDGQGRGRRNAHHGCLRLCDPC